MKINAKLIKINENPCQFKEKVNEYPCQIKETINENPLLPLVAFVVVIIGVLVVIIVVAIVAIIVIVIGVSVSSSSFSIPHCHSGFIIAFFVVASSSSAGRLFRLSGSVCTPRLRRFPVVLALLGSSGCSHARKKPPTKTCS